MLSNVDNRRELLDESWGLNLAGADDIAEQMNQLAAESGARQDSNVSQGLSMDESQPPQAVEVGARQPYKLWSVPESTVLVLSEAE